MNKALFLFLMIAPSVAFAQTLPKDTILNQPSTAVTPQWRTFMWNGKVQLQAGVNGKYLFVPTYQFLTAANNIWNGDQTWTAFNNTFTNGIAVGEYPSNGSFSSSGISASNGTGGSFNLSTFGTLNLNRTGASMGLVLNPGGNNYINSSAPVEFLQSVIHQGTATLPDEFVTLKELSSHGSVAGSGLTKTDSVISLGGTLTQPWTEDVTGQPVTFLDNTGGSPKTLFQQNSQAVNIAAVDPTGNIYANGVNNNNKEAVITRTLQVPTLKQGAIGVNDSGNFIRDDFYNEGIHGASFFPNKNSNSFAQIGDITAATIDTTGLARKIGDANMRQNSYRMANLTTQPIGLGSTGTVLTSVNNRFRYQNLSTGFYREIYSNFNGNGVYKFPYLAISTLADSTGVVNAIIAERTAMATLTNKTLTDPIVGNQLASDYSTKAASTKWVADALNAAAANIPPNTRQINTGYGLLGGGDLSVNRTHLVDTTVIVSKPYLASYAFTKAQSNNNYFLATSETRNIATTGTFGSGDFTSSGNINATGLATLGGIAVGTMNTNLFISNNTGLAPATSAAGLQFAGSTVNSYRMVFGGGNGSTTVSTGRNYSGVISSGSIFTTAAGAVIPWAVNTLFKPLGTITLGSGSSVTNTANVYFDGASTQGTNNYTIAVAGVSNFLGNIQNQTLNASQLVVSDANKNLVSSTALPSGTTATTPTASGQVATKGYVDGLTSTAVIVSSASTLTLAYGTDYVFSGSTATYTLPAVSASNATRKDFITIKNRGTGSITVNGTIYDGSAVSSFTIAAGSAVTLVQDGTYFNRE